MPTIFSICLNCGEALKASPNDCSAIWYEHMCEKDDVDLSMCLDAIKKLLVKKTSPTLKLPPLPPQPPPKPPTFSLQATKKIFQQKPSSLVAEKMEMLSHSDQFPLRGENYDGKRKRMQR